MINGILIPTSCGTWFIIDESEVEVILPISWSLINGYVRCNRTKNRPRKFLAHYISRYTELDRRHKLVVDHINNNKLDNRKSNLRITSHSVNNSNRQSIIHKGYHISKEPRIKKYCACVWFNNKKYVKYFMTAREAQQWYYNKYFELRGNFPNIKWE